MTATRPRALITGGSSGIGRALALEFALRGFDLLLTGRDRNALEGVAADCRQTHSVAADVFVADLSQASEVAALIRDLTRNPVEVLVNNAGFGVKGSFADTELERELQLVEVQVNSMLRLTKSVLPSMVAVGRGRILNIASVYSVAPVPRQSVYAATKAFLLSFSAALGEELRDTGVTVTTSLPGVTRTEFRRRAGMADRSGAGMSAEAVARAAVDATLRGRTWVIPGLSNRLFVFLTRHLPVTGAARLVTFINNRRGVNQ